MSVLTASFGNGMRSLLSIYGIGTEEFQVNRFSEALLIQVRRLAFSNCVRLDSEADAEACL